MCVYVYVCVCIYTYIYCKSLKRETARERESAHQRARETASHIYVYICILIYIYIRMYIYTHTNVYICITARTAAPLPAANFSPDMKYIRVSKASTNICCHKGDLNRASPDAYTCTYHMSIERLLMHTPVHMTTCMHSREGTGGIVS